MKHILRKLHIGSSHEPPRSNDPGAASPAQSCGSDHRAAVSWSPNGVPPQSPSPSSSPGGEGSAGSRLLTEDKNDYFSSEEEFQVQLALAISASNSEFRAKDQGKAVILGSGHMQSGSSQTEDLAECLSRRYWDYDVLDYEDKVLDGFYDIHGLSADPSSQGMPSLVDLQMTTGASSYEVVIVNRAIDPALDEMEQVARCIALDCHAPEVGLLNCGLVQRIADLVSEHMGGPVRDANDMLARWMERSFELQATLHTNIYPIGCLKIGISRHRALLFKVLADTVGILCRLVKGSLYTGIDDGAVVIIKSEDQREFLVDLMGAPGTLIPADILPAKDVPMDDQRSNRNLLPRTGYDRNRDRRTSNEVPIMRNNGILDVSSRTGKVVSQLPLPSPNGGAISMNHGNRSDGILKGVVPVNQDFQLSSSAGATSSSKQRGDCGSSIVCDGVNEKRNVVPPTQDNMDSENLFADLNPFQKTGAGKIPAQNQVGEKKIFEYQRRRENIYLGPGRPPLPLAWKNRNEIPRTKQQESGEGLFPRNNVDIKAANASASLMNSDASKNGELDSSVFRTPQALGSLNSSRTGSVDNDTENTSVGNVVNMPYDSGDSSISSKVGGTELSCVGGSAGVERSYSPSNGILDPLALGNNRPMGNPGDGIAMDNYGVVDESKEPARNRKYHIDKRKCTNDRFMEPKLTSNDQENPGPVRRGLSRLDPMLDDVSEWEIPWEDLVVGERIGLGSYGEVYHADWNGTEVAVKKFLDQDFSGDAIEEFRSEVRIMRRLRHPNVVLFMGAVTRPPNLSIVTEFLPRGSLYRLLHRPNCQIDEKRRIKMALDVAKGMNCLHSSTPTIVHRDLKSPNLLVDRSWNVKVCDFGLSRMKHNTFLSSKSTAGTPEWMAPEVLRNEPSNEKCDVYSFGIILWELATLRMPWSGMNPMQVVGAVGFQNRRLDIPKEVDPLVARIIWECWQTDPNLRPSFAQLASALKPLQQLVVSQQLDAQSSPMPQEIPVNSAP
ncbi:serine/threonine-protein kinase EDR1 [Amborella trichopoda]|uniref:non-specific serine/threonine protein kinase n=1 Tax=Amborella trichopoda TaxID=13333 RepID=W1NDG6_AMBTC|nr:serine/threonine-protein kinase EDR1 [Amborella trichopoda]ERM93492.1 hypothetical protein AMTR_s00004p00023800 [Amborella trichopoda]|eukprot:XP_006826255.1 serine/threonine-protein kinase EDR1 [Amborella trichopoda]